MIILYFVPIYYIFLRQYAQEEENSVRNGNILLFFHILNVSKNNQYYDFLFVLFKIIQYSIILLIKTC